MKKLEQYLTKKIESYLEGNMDLDPDNDFEDILDIVDAINPKKMAKEIAEELHTMVLTFEPTPLLDTSLHYSCPKCYRNIGVWKSVNGMTLSDSSVLENKKRIIIIDDIK